MVTATRDIEKGKTAICSPATQYNDANDVPSLADSRFSSSNHLSSYSSVDDLIVSWQEDETDGYAGTGCSDVTETLTARSVSRGSNAGSTRSSPLITHVDAQSRSSPTRTLENLSVRPMYRNYGETAEAASPRQCSNHSATTPDAHRSRHPDSTVGVQENECELFCAPTVKMPRRSVRVPPSLGISSPRRKGTAPGCVKLPIWFQKPQNPSQVSKFLERVRSRLIFVNRRLHYLNNEKRALLSCLWSMEEDVTPLWFPDCSTATPRPSQKSAAAGKQLLEISPGHLSREYPRKHAERTLSADMLPFCSSHSATTPPSKPNTVIQTGLDSSLNTSLSRDVTLWNASKESSGAVSEHLFLRLKYNKDVVTREVASEDAEVIDVESNVPLFYPHEQTSFSPTPFLPEDASQHDCVAITGGLDTFAVGKPKLDMEFLMNLLIEKQQNNQAPFKNGGIGDESLCEADKGLNQERSEVISSTHSDSCPHEQSASGSSVAPATRKKTKTDENKPQFQLNSATDFSTDYWNSLSDQALRLWMAFFGMKSSEHSIRRQVMITELTRISAYVCGSLPNTSEEKQK